MFTTLMHELHGTKNIVFGGKASYLFGLITLLICSQPGEQLQYKGMAGNQVLEWADLDTEIKVPEYYRSCSLIHTNVGVDRACKERRSSWAI